MTVNGFSEELYFKTMPNPDITAMVVQAREYLLQGNPHQALAIYRELSDKHPDNPDIHIQTGRLFARLGAAQQATICYRQALMLDENSPEAHAALAIVLHSQGDTQQAATHYRHALAINPEQPTLLFNLGAIYQQQGQIDKAEECYRSALSIKPDYVMAIANLAYILKSRGRLKESEQLYRQALSFKPDSAEILYNLSLTLQAMMQFDEAIEHMRQCVHINPDHVDARIALGVLYRLTGKLTEAANQFLRAHHLNPSRIDPHLHLGSCYNEMYEHDSAIMHHKFALEIDPDSADAYDHWGTTLLNMGMAKDAIEKFNLAIDRCRCHHSANTNLLFSLTYIERDSELLLRKHEDWARDCAPAAPRKNHSNTRDPDRVLRIGYISSDFRNHPVSYFFEPILEFSRKSNVINYCYANSSAMESTTKRLIEKSDEWRNIYGLDDNAVAQLIDSDAIDILIDLNGHTGDNRLPVFSLKPAPVQVTYLGYPGTTGLKTIDYRIADHVTDPQGFESHYTETLFRLNGPFSCFSIPRYAPDCSPTPAMKNGYVTFGSLNTLSKLNPAVLDCWSRLLANNPTTVLLIYRSSLTKNTQSYLMREFSSRGVAVDRVRLINTPYGNNFLDAYKDIDIALDTFPWNGHTTTCQALWMGVPVITIAGDRHACRMCASVLTHLGFPELVADNEDDYLARASSLSMDIESLEWLRTNLRPMMRASPVCNGEKFTRMIEDAYRGMWKTWCDNQH